MKAPTRPKPKYSFTSDGTNITAADVARLARSPLDERTAQALLTAGMSVAARRRVERSRAIVDGVVERGEVVYGVSTGFGAFKDRVISRDDLARLQVNLIM